MTRVDDDLRSFERDGYVILEGVLSPSELGDLRAAIEAFELGRPMGRNDFEGTRSHRVYSLAAKGEVFTRVAEHPRVVEMLDRLLLPNWLLSTFQSIRLHPGETAQAWHCDDGFYPFPRPRPLHLAVSVIFALEDFTRENGATELAVGSHRWNEEHPDDRPETYTQAVMKAGSAVVFDGALWHRGQANRSSSTRLALSPQYCQPFLRPQESQLLIVPKERARAMSDRMRAMLGYSIHPPFMGQVEGMHPLRLVDEAYREHKTGDARTADRILDRPPADMTSALLARDR